MTLDEDIEAEVQDDRVGETFVDGGRGGVAAGDTAVNWTEGDGGFPAMTAGVFGSPDTGIIFVYLPFFHCYPFYLLLI